MAQIPELNRQKQQLQTEIQTILNEADGKTLKPYQKLGLARNYYHLDQYAEAEQYYLQVITEPFCTNLDYKALAICLKHSGKTSLANEFFEAYKQEVPMSNFIKMWSIDSENDKGVTKTTENLISQYDFLYGNLNPDGTVNLNIDHGTVTATVGCNAITNMEGIQFPVEAFNKLGSFTRGDKEGSFYYSYQKPNAHFGIFYISFHKGKWSKPKELVLGPVDQDYCFPYFINATLYFSSDKRGGFGQFDLYKANVKGKQVLEISNLGAEVNTDKNEILPSVWDGKFSFSSNGYPGAGGYDVFFSDWSFKRVESLKQPFNSHKDEYVVLQHDTKSATLIRSEELSINLVNVQFYIDYLTVLNGLVVDADANSLDEARVLFTKSYVDQGVFQTSNNGGRFEMIIPDTIDTWMIECHKDGYHDNKFELDLRTLGENPLIIVLHKIQPIEPEPVYIVNSPSRNVIPSEPDSTVDSTNIVPNDFPFNEVDNTGRFYVVYASTKTYASAYRFWEEWRLRLPDLEILKNEELGVYRVGSYAGTTRSEAMKHYKSAQKVKSDVWILRPDML